MLHCCSGCGFELFFSGYPEDNLCRDCRSYWRKYGRYSDAAKAEYQRRSREEAERFERQHRTMRFRDGRRGADGIPSPSDWNY